MENIERTPNVLLLCFLEKNDIMRQRINKENLDVIAMDMDTLGYFILMNEQEKTKTSIKRKKIITKAKDNCVFFREAQTGRGKPDHQKSNPHLILQYVMEHTDEEHMISVTDIVAYYQEYYSIYAECRHIYKGIDEINKVLYMLENELSIQDSKKAIDAESTDSAPCHLLRG